MTSFVRSGYLKDSSGVAAIEAALYFPILILLLLGMLDLGYGILASQKTIRASQVVSDLVARVNDLDSDGINDVIEAGRLALSPFPTDSFAVDIASIYYDENDSPEVCWRETVNMSPNSDIPANDDGLGADGDAAIAVTVRYDYEPRFSSHVIDTISMQEVAYSRGRRTTIVQRDGGCE